MPQLDLATFPGQLLWLAVTFTVLFAVMAWLAMPRIGGVLEERQRRIDENLERATALKAEADAALAAYEKLLTTARTEARDALRTAAERAGSDAERRKKELGDRLAAQIKQGDENIVRAKEQALAQIRDIAADIAKSAASRLAGINVDDGQAARAVAAVAQGQERN